MNSKLLQSIRPQNWGVLLSRLLAIADDAVIVTDASQCIVLFNEGAERIFGWPMDTVLGRDLGMLLPEAQRPVHAEHVRGFARSARAARRMGDRSDLRGRRADGSLFDAEASISRLDLEGQTYFAAILRDVTEARRAERALVESEARFRGLAAAAPVGIFQADAQGRYVYVNDRWCAIAGMDGVEAAGDGWLRGLHPADRAQVRHAWRMALAGRGPFDMRYRFLRPDGQECWVMANAVASLDIAGRAEGYIGTITDVTESHQQAQALERAKSEAEAAVRAKSLFLANMSHEIRTPLNAVVGMTTLLLDTPMSEDQRDFARTIRSSSDSLLEIINDILDYSKADVGKLELDRRPFDLRRLVEESLDLISPKALEKGLNLAYLIEDGTPEALVGDPARVRQILVNLLTNAVKFTHQGEVFIGVDGEAVDAETHRIRFSVKDTGIGIAAEDLPRLFQSFTQVDASTTRKYGGTGLGLAISKRLAELMGGGVEVQSEPGLGSVFHVHVLAAREGAAEKAEFLRRDAPALAGKRVLIVDDNQTNRRILTKLTLLWGMLPATFPSALEAMDRVRHGEPYDVALLDMSMPQYDGVDLAREIRRQRGPNELPIIMLTSLGQRHALQATEDAGLTVCLSKPIKAGQLFDTLVSVFDGPVREEPAAPAAAAPPRTARLRVLVAEDNTINQRVAARLLQHLGCEADIAANGALAVEAVARSHYDVVLMDIQMPEMDGVQAARAIVEQRGPYGPPRIIAMTANAMPGDREAYLKAGMDGYLAKPVDVNDLASVLAQAGALARLPMRAAGDAPGAGGAEVIDHRRLEHLRSMQDDSQPSLVRELIDMFLADSSGHLRRLAESQARGDLDGLRAGAHRFLSTTQNIGATQLSGLCLALEQAARDGDDVSGQALIDALVRECEQVHEALAAARVRY